MTDDTTPSPRVLREGELYSPHHTSWREGAPLCWDPGWLYLQFFVPTPSTREARAVRQGQMQLGLISDDPDCAHVLYRVSAPRRPHKDAPIRGHVPYNQYINVPPELRPDPQQAPSRLAFAFHLVDALTGIFVALREGTLSPEFTQAWHAVMRAQASRDEDLALFIAARDRLSASYPSLASARRAATLSYVGA